MNFNGHFRNKAYNSVRWACLYSLAPKREMRKYHSVWLRKLVTHAECFAKHSRMGTARMTQDHETDEDTQKRSVSMEKRTASTNKSSPDGLSHPNRNTIMINII